ncbi:MAG: hypothetical protein KVP17_003571 [Porospora cf. gigantea B]|uniref:uncharacterized protein n=1 Tax=Porospora cf. gigantea B TaxID=2853592 RepID=UPI003571D2C3|nr:MAG: hypothetical protein KVP17_003571 [Porospora cf. gigantea B]
MDSKVRTFVDLTACGSDEVARSYLEAANRDLNNAVALFFESGGEYQESDADIAHRLAAEDQVRDADATYTEQLLSHGPYSPVEREAVQRDVIQEESSDLARMYAPPDAITLKGDLPLALRTSESQNKPLLVNIQDPEMFRSHELNRDVWASELVQTIIAESFVFWQAAVNTPSGTRFVDQYAAREVPCIAVVYPRRPARFLNMTDFIDPNGAVIQLLGVLDEPEAPAERVTPAESTPSASSFPSPSSHSRMNPPPSRTGPVPRRPAPYPVMEAPRPRPAMRDEPADPPLTDTERQQQHAVNQEYQHVNTELAALAAARRRRLQD